MILRIFVVAAKIINYLVEEKTIFPLLFNPKTLFDLLKLYFLKTAYRVLFYLVSERYLQIMCRLNLVHGRYQEYP
jgi:hypothetical protein